MTLVHPRVRWVVVPPPDPQQVVNLARSLQLPETLTSLLIQRGHDTPESAKRFLRPSLDDLSDPFLLQDMRHAVRIVAEAVRGGRTILVHGDYDVDGQCATALLTRVLREAGAAVVPFIPHRLRDGYDFGPAGLAAARQHDAGLIITCDCGTSARATVEQARAEGRQVVVTDHHLPTGPLPPADAVLNPQRPDCPSHAGELCGAGVAFKLAQAVVADLGLPVNLPYHLLDLVALATVADVVPLRGENRILVRFGLRLLGNSRWPGIRALVEVAGLTGGEVRAGQVGFILAPRLNAAGRIGDPMDGLHLLLSDEPADALSRSEALEALNTRRQALDQEILAQAVEMVERAIDLERDHALVLAGEGWHPGVIGIVASRLVERYARPTVLVALEGEEGRGSGRSIPGFDLHGALSVCDSHLVRYGGHRMAAGLSVRRDRLDAFREAFGDVARSRLTPDDLIPMLRVDITVAVEELDDRLERLLRHLEPSGPGNPGPVLGVREATAKGANVVGTNHIKFTLEDETAAIQSIGFGWADRLSEDWSQGAVDVALRLERNDWRGSSTLQARVVDVRRAD
jgi:single-stranded-DNA-specific exonuclease